MRARFVGDLCGVYEKLSLAGRQDDRESEYYRIVRDVAAANIE